MRRLWTGEVVDHAGEHFTLTGAQQRPVPTRHIPVTVGGVGPRTLEIVSTHAAWWNVPIHELDKLEARRALAGYARVSVQSMVALARYEAPRDAERTRVVSGKGGSVRVEPRER